MKSFGSKKFQITCREAMRRATFIPEATSIPDSRVNDLSITWQFMKIRNFISESGN